MVPMRMKVPAEISSTVYRVTYLQKKLTRVNFVAILIDGTTDRSVKEQEVLYVMFVDPDTHKPCLAFFQF